MAFQSLALIVDSKVVGKWLDTINGSQIFFQKMKKIFLQNLSSTHLSGQLSRSSDIPLCCECLPHGYLLLLGQIFPVRFYDLFKRKLVRENELIQHSTQHFELSTIWADSELPYSSYIILGLLRIVSPRASVTCHGNEPYLNFDYFH